LTGGAGADNLPPVTAQPSNPELPRRVTVYTDGGCRPNPGPGGWGAVVELPEGPLELSGSEMDSTNNRMELTAAVRALEALPPGTEVDLVTDSTYVEQGITKWLAGWRRRGWLTAAKEPVKNRDLWQALDEAARRHRVRWRWTRGHAGHDGNERAHELAAAAIPRPPRASSARPAPAVGAGSAVAASRTAPPSPGAGPAGEQAAPLAGSPDTVDVFLGVAWSATRKRGAWGAILRWGELERELAGPAGGTSANAAHVAGAALALEAVRRPVPVRVVTVSDYLRDGATLWLPAWRERGWKTREGQPVASREWWERLERQLRRLAIDWDVPEGDPPPPEVKRARELARAALAED
jgi:ribonuclease HI